MLLAEASSAQAATITWTNTSGGNWSVLSNWSPNQVPGAADTAEISMSGTYTVALDTSISISGLTLGGGVGTQTLANAASTLTINGPGIVKSHGVLTLSGGTLAGSGPMTVNGAMNWTAGTLQGGGPVTVYGG